MPQDAPFPNLGGLTYSEDVFYRILDELFTIGTVGATDYQVIQNHLGANMSVDVNAGSAYVAVAGGGKRRTRLPAQSNSGTPGAPNSADNWTTTFVAADVTNPRVDRVVLTVQDSSIDGSGAYRSILRVVAGTPTSGATLANLNGAAAVPANSLLLANVLVPANATTVVTANIADITGVATVWNAFATSAGTDLTIVGSTLTPTNGFHRCTSADGWTLTSISTGLLAPGTGSFDLVIRFAGSGTITSSANIFATPDAGQLTVLKNATVHFRWDPNVSAWFVVDLSPTGLYKLWDSVEAGVTLPAAAISTPTLLQTFKHLVIEFYARASVAGPVQFFIQANGDTGANYEAAATATSEAGVVSAIGSLVANGWSTSSIWSVNGPGMVTARIPWYTSGFDKVLGGVFTGRDASHVYAGVFGGHWKNASAITSLRFGMTTGNLDSLTRITVYGEA